MPNLLQLIRPVSLVFFTISMVYSVMGQQLQLTPEETAFIESHPVITFGGEPEWEPMIVMDGNKVTGFDRDMLDEISVLTGIKFKIEAGRWATIVQKAKDHEIDGLLYSSPLVERTPYFNFSVPYIHFQAGFYGELSDPYVNSLKKLAGSAVAVQKGDQFSTNYIDSLGMFNRVEMSERIDIVKAILSGEIDYYFGAMDMSYYLNRHGITTIKTVYLPPNINFTAVYSVRKDYPELISILNKSMAALPIERKNQLLTKWNFLYQTSLIVDKELAYNIIGLAIVFTLLTSLWIVTIFKQIKEKKAVRQQLSKEKAQLVSQIENSSALIFSLDRDLNILVRNYNFNLFIKSISGRPIKVGDNLMEFIPEDYQELWVKRYQRGLEGQKFTIEDNISITGTRKSFITSINPIKIDNNIIGITCISEDMTEYTSLNRYMLQLMQTSHDFIFIKDRKLRYKVASQSFAELNGYASWKELIGKSDLDLDPKNADQYRTEEEKVINEGVFSLNKLHLFKDREGIDRWVQSSNEPIYDEEGHIIGLSGISRDVTSEKNAEREQRMLIATIENSRDFVCFLDESLQFIYINDFGKEMLGITDVNEVKLENLVKESNLKLLRYNLKEKVKLGKTWRTEFPMMNQKSSEPIGLDHSFIRINNINGDFICYGNVARDVTERNILSQQLIDITIKQQLMKSTLQAEENERNRIAKELHDGIQQKLALAVISLQGSEKKGSQGHVIKLLNEGISDLREMSHSLSPISLQRNGLASVINDEVARLNKLAQIKVSFFENFSERRLDEEIEINLYRIFQECVSNTLKHSKASILEVQLILSDEIVTLTIEDDGIGFDTNESSTNGFGLNSIRNRIHLINGHLEISSLPNKGTSILIEIRL